MGQYKQHVLHIHEALLKNGPQYQFRRQSFSRQSISWTCFITINETLYESMGMMSIHMDVTILLCRNTNGGLTEPSLPV